MSLRSDSEFRWLPMLFVTLLYFFFLQAEDGIRDTSVTGVQTCALPISLVPPAFHRKKNAKQLVPCSDFVVASSCASDDGRRSQEASYPLSKRSVRRTTSSMSRDRKDRKSVV